MKAFYILICFCLLFLSCKSKEGSSEPIIQIPIEGNEQIYASSNHYNDVESFAKSFDSSVKIVAVKSQDVNTDGSSKSWKYEFVSTDKKIMYYFTRTFDSIGFDSTGSIMDGISAITNNWINSNAALNSSENNGGRTFRNNHSNCQISASLAQLQTTNSIPLWYIKYSCSSEYLYVVINAVTGEFYSN